MIFNYLINKNAFQSMDHLPLANRISITCNLTLEWPWPSLWLIVKMAETSNTTLNECPGSKTSIFTVWLWCRDSQDVPPYKNEVSQKILLKQTHTQTRRPTDKQPHTLNFEPKCSGITQCSLKTFKTDFPSEDHFPRISISYLAQISSEKLKCMDLERI